MVALAVFDMQVSERYALQGIDAAASVNEVPCSKT
jgi:hypothetical protein